MKPLKKNSFHEKLHKWFSNDTGFTLIEAIVTVAIVGAVITPIAMIFQGALETSLLTKNQLKANQLAQQYVEAVEVMDYIDLKELVDAGGIINAASIATYGLPDLINGMNVSVDLHYGAYRSDGITEDTEYNDGSDGFDTDEFEMPILSGTSIDYDVYLYLDSSANDKIEIYSRDKPEGGALGTEQIMGGLIQNRDINITYEYDTGSPGYTKLTVKQPGSVPYPASYNAITISRDVVIYCDDILTIPANQQKTYVNVTNTTSERVNVYVFETLLDTIKPIITIVNGEVGTIRGEAEVDTSIITHRIFEVEVTIDDDLGTELTHVVTTIIAK